jgi:hypothetical protein
MKKVLFVFAVLVSFLIQSQEKTSVNSFKYVVVPIKLDFLKEQDQYQTSSLSKFLLEKSGFKTYLSNEIFPEDLSKDRCLALTANIQKKSSFLSTKIYVELLDCRNNLIYQTDVFTTKEKNYKKAYREVLRKAFKPIQALNYSFTPTQDLPKKDEPKKEKVKERKKPDTVVLKKDVRAKNEHLSSSELTAKSIKNGFNLFDSKSKLIYKILKTNAENIFIVKDKNGAMYKDGGYWVIEYYDANNKLVKRKYKIRF